MRATLSVPIDRLARAGLIALAMGFVAACGGGGGGGSSGGGAAPAVVAAPAPAPVAPPPVVAPVVAPVVVAPVVVPPVPVGVSPNITLALNASRLTGVAPLAVTFDAIGTTASTTSLPFHEIRYSWNFGETANNSAYNATWAYGTRPGANSKDVAFGPVAAHVFETPGTYTVSLTGFDGTNTSTRTATVTVTDPNTVFANNTIYISQSGVPVPGQNGVPLGATVQQVTNWNTVQTLAQTYKRILLRRGDTWTATAGVALGASHAGPGLIGAYGSGNKPVVSASSGMTHIAINAGANDWRVVDLFFTGASQAERTWSKGIVTQGAVNALFLRTDVRWAWTLSSLENSDGVYLVDSVLGLVSDQGASRGYANWTANVSRIAFLGTRLHGSDAHTIRWQGVDAAVFSNCTVDTPKGPAAWSMLTIRGKSNDGNNGVWNGLWTENVVVSDTYIASGPPTAYATFSMAPQNNESAERLRNVIVERNHVVSLGSEAMIFAVASGLTVRNNILQSLYGSTLAFNSANTAGSPDSSQSFVYNNTLYKPNTSVSAGYSAINSAARVTGQVIRNNLAYAPGSTSPTMFGGAAVEGVNYAQSNNSNNAQILSNRPWQAATPVTAAEFTPVGSYAIGAGTNVKSWTDFFANPFPSQLQIGAINP